MPYFIPYSLPQVHDYSDMSPMAKQILWDFNTKIVMDTIRESLLLGSISVLLTIVWLAFLNFIEHKSEKENYKTFTNEPKNNKQVIYKNKIDVFNKSLKIGISILPLIRDLNPNDFYIKFKDDNYMLYVINKNEYILCDRLKNNKILLIEYR